MVTKVIDARGLFCPGPLQVLRGVAKQLEPGSILMLIADDSDSKDQIREWCKETGNKLESVTEENGDLTFKIVLKC